VYAFLIPVLHFALYAAGLLDPVSRAAREIALLIFMAALGGIVIREHFALQKWNRRLRAELDAAQDHLQQSRKMEAVGRLAGGVAHDFNNLLMIIRGYSELLLDQASTPGLMRSGIEQIHSAADRAAALTRQLLAFSRKQVIAPEAVHLDEVVRGLEPLLSRLIGENIELAARHAPGLWPVRADRSQVEQIILNLAANGRDAMPSGGRLTLATRNVSAQESTTFAGLAPRDYALLEVSDTGMGMDAETQARAFEPFFTTKTAGKGTGLGLATVYAIVQQADGASFLESHPGRGTTLRVFLPRTITAAAPERAAPRESAGVGSGTVLLVEDEHGVRRLAREFLESSGYTVLEAGNGTEALEMADGYAGSIDLMVTDVIMPGMNGRELAERLVARRPTTKVLFVSGHTDDAVMQQGVFESSMEFLQKPFTKAGLAEKVYKVLHG
jgi:signal transduction histidine kinase/CheY-like chemotaxis protein